MNSYWRQTTDEIYWTCVTFLTDRGHFCNALLPLGVGISGTCHMRMLVTPFDSFCHWGFRALPSPARGHFKIPVKISGPPKHVRISECLAPSWRMGIFFTKCKLLATDCPNFFLHHAYTFPGLSYWSAASTLLTTHPCRCPNFFFWISSHIWASLQILRLY
jgi:hypothetical protein